MFMDVKSSKIFETLLRFPLILTIIYQLIFVFSHNAIAGSFPEVSDVRRNALNSCEITRTFIDNYEPLKFNSINNLLRTTGETSSFRGKTIFLRGRVLDEACVPISDAKIYLWQVGDDGKYPYRTLRNVTDLKMLNSQDSSGFAGSGIATSNNNGEYLFITLLPPPPYSKKEPAHFNIRVEHNRLGIVQTKYYPIKANRSPNSNLEYNDPSNYGTDKDVYEFNIVMPGTINKRY